MAVVRSAPEAVARIAWACSDVVLSVQPSLHDASEFSPTWHALRDASATSIVSGQAPQVDVLRWNADPFLSAFAPARAHKLVTLTTTTSTLIAAIPHLTQLAQYPVVAHVSVVPHERPDFSDVTAIRQSGFILLQSETIQEAQDIALTAHALARRSGKGVIHFFDASNSKKDDAVAIEQDTTVRAIFLQSSSNSVNLVKTNSTSIYVDDGERPTIPELGLPSPTLTSSAPPTALPTLSSTGSAVMPSEGNSSSDSSPRGSSSDSQDASSATSVASVRTRAVVSDDIVEFLEEIWSKLAGLTGRTYSPFEYTGSTSAAVALFLFGSSGLFVDELGAPNAEERFGQVGLLTARLYRPWLGAFLRKALPSSVQRVAVLEQVRHAHTKWGPTLLDVLGSLRADPVSEQAPMVVGYQLGHLQPETAGQALRGILQNLHSPKPIQNLKVGAIESSTPSERDGSNLLPPRIESEYLAFLTQVFEQRLYVANRADDSNAGISRSIAASPEFGFGALLARIDRRRQFVREVTKMEQSKDFASSAVHPHLTRWLQHAEDPTCVNSLATEVVDRLQTDGSPLAQQLMSMKSLFFQESLWLIGSDAWAYDLGNSGVHHVLASGANVNMLIIDSQPHSEESTTDALRRKKDIGLYAMNFGNAYVASIAVYQPSPDVRQALLEADRFAGPSIILAHLPYDQKRDTVPSVLEETMSVRESAEQAVESGYWPLYRWNPSNEEHNRPNFELQSGAIRKEMSEFLDRDNRLTHLMTRQPDFSANLSSSLGSEIRTLQRRKAQDAYQKMLDGLYGAPLTVLFASDNGNAESLAKRLGTRGKARGLKTKVLAMDEYSIDDLPTEENVVLMTSTAGQGEFPQNGRAFWEAVKTGETKITDVLFSVFALGDSHYWPRKEDKIYYNKPGKDLDARLLGLGGKHLTDIGLGDDQDPDGYQTGYNEWEPRLWQALNVDKVEGLPEEPPPLTNEDIKIQSNYLRGTIQEGLDDTSTGAISASDGQLTKFHGTYQQDNRDERDNRKAMGLEPAYSFMIRCRLNGGVATPSQWLQMDAISTEHGNQTMKLTTRQTFQFHGVVKAQLKPAMRAINRALMTTLAACGDVNRNVMVSVLPQNSALHHDVHQISARIADHLLPATNAYHEIWIQDEKDQKTQVAGNALVDQEPLYGPTYLPRKFKITIAVPPHNDTDVYAHDVGLIAITDANGRLAGFNFLAGGGMGVTHNNKKTYPRTGSMLGYAPAAEAHLVCEKIMLVQRDHGDRTNRKHARLKYTIDDLGVDVFRGKVEELLGHKLEEARPFEFTSNVDTFGWQRDEIGMNHFLMFIENGRVEDTDDFKMKTGLREIAKVHNGEFRLTPNQHLCLSNVTDADRPAIEALLKQYKLDNTAHSGLRLSSSACVAFPTCGLAMAESERYLPRLVSLLESHLESLGLRDDSVVMRMTGCPNGCARPWLAEVGLVGKALGAYNLYLGGGYHGQRLNKLFRSSIGEEDILDILKPLFTRWAQERWNELERFGDWLLRAGVIKETTAGKNFHDDVAEEESDEE